MLLRQSRLLLLAAVIGSLTLLSSTSQATPVSGNLNIDGSASVGAVVLQFLCGFASTPGANPCPANSGNFITSATSTGSFTPYVNDPGFIQNISQVAQPINTPFLLSNFITFSPILLTPDIALDLTFLYAGDFSDAQCGLAAAPGQICTPLIPGLVSPNNPSGKSAFDLVNTSASSSTASFSVSGIARRLSTGEQSAFNGVFSAQFSNLTYQQLLDQLATTGSVSSTYSASFTATTVPEPGSTMMVLGGLCLALGSISRKHLQAIVRRVK